MPLNAILRDNLDAGNHQYRVYIPGTAANLLDSVAAEYVRLRTACLLPLRDISFDGLQMNTGELQARIQQATVPRYKGGNFDVLRSDFGELIAYLLLEEHFGTRFGFKSLRCRELTNLSARGIDAIGVETGGPSVLVITEVKVSDSALSPPNVVDSANDCLRKQHLHHITDRRKVADKIWDKAREVADADLRDIYFQAALGLEADNSALLEIRLTSVLVRPTVRYSDTDFGSFRDSPSDYKPGMVRFLVFCVDNSIDAVIRELDQVLLNSGDQNE